ncbi:MAG TPA: hypothetical protein K8V15_07530 [Tessaracoccus flavescens]|uniref:Uncharacterized protein n=1 Tax=Tessaracoccus flavescens TaxID=399497 RepID=A0A921JQR0_9ACTN|nr:hypothetical protein [Tessaracoccus flavescens]
MVQAPNLTKTQVSESLDDQARTFAATAARLGFSLPEALNAVKNGWPT